MQVLCWTALLLWVHAGRGAGYLAALFAAGDSAAARALAHPGAVRWVVTAIVAAGVAGPLRAYRRPHPRTLHEA